MARASDSAADDGREAAVRIDAPAEDPDPEQVAARSREAGALGWARRDEPGRIRVHAEGSEEQVAAVVALFGSDALVERVKCEGHEQFAVRGVPAGGFEVIEAEGGGFELALELGDGWRRWSLPKAPSMDPAVKRMAFRVAADAGSEAPAGDLSTWDSGTYEQGGRVPWPEAVDRGHAVFVLHGERLSGGFALQRIRRGWLLIKRRDEHARRDDASSPG